MVTREFSQDVPKGFVISSDPGAGTERHAGSAIALTVSKGSPVEVADVTGASVADATSELEQAGLKVKIATQQVNSEFDQGQIAQQSPKAGSQVAGGDTVTLTVSKGPEMVSVPDVVGATVDDAKKTLEDAGLPGQRGPRAARALRGPRQEPVGGGRQDRAQGVDDLHRDPLNHSGAEATALPWPRQCRGHGNSQIHGSEVRRRAVRERVTP